MRDKEFGMIRLRGYGIFSYRVNNPSLFLKDILNVNYCGITKRKTINGG